MGSAAIHFNVLFCAVALDGGGYQWRIAPAGAELTEAEFQKTVLPFEGMSSLRWGGKSGKQLFFNATRVSSGTVPENSTWTMKSGFEHPSSNVNVE